MYSVKVLDLLLALVTGKFEAAATVSAPSSSRLSSKGTYSRQAYALHVPTRCPCHAVGVGETGRSGRQWRHAGGGGCG